MRKLIVMIFFAAILAPMSVLASIYGVLSGHIVDADGKGIVGATVMVEGTTRGTNVKSRDGSFTVSNITAGNYTVSVRFVGKQQHKVNVRISADQTTNIKVVLQDDAVMMDSVVVTAAGATPKRADETSIGSIATLSSEEITRQSGSNLASVIGMSAGVSSGGDGFAVRGSRSSETQIRVDGLNVGNQFTGGFGAGGSGYFPMVSSYATEEVQVITGNFAAQYGDAQGGVINTVAKSGRTDRYEGYARWQTDVPFLSGSQDQGVEVYQEEGRYKMVEGGEGLDYIVGGFSKYEFGIGGPLSFINDKSTFYISAYTQSTKHGSGYDINDPWGNSRIISPVAGSWGRNITARLKYGITNDVSLLIGGAYGLAAGQSSSFRYGSEIGTPYLNAAGEIDPQRGTPTSNGISQMDGKTRATNQFVQNALARINHTLTDNSFYEITFAVQANNEESGRKVIGSNMGFLTGFELMEPVDNWVVSEDRWSQATLVDGRLVGDKAVDWASPVVYTGLSADGYCNSQWGGINPFTGYHEGEMYYSSTNNPWGIPNIVYSGGDGGGFDFRYGSYLMLDGNYNLYGMQTGDFKHTIKAGFEGYYFTMDRHLNEAAWSGNPVYDIYSDMWGGNIYADSMDVYNKTSKAVNQLKFGAYAQDQIVYKGIVANLGLRLDLLDPMNKYRVMDPVLPQFIPISSDSGFADATVKAKISPRISINYPITESSFISIAYGQFFQAPSIQYLYDRFNVEHIDAGTMVGDPNMEAQQTNQYQINYENQLSDEFALRFSAYYKDIYNQLGVSQIMTVPTSYMQYTVSEYGTSRGFEVTVDKFMSNNFAFSLNYGLAFLSVTAAGVTSNSAVQIDPYSGELTFPLAPYYSSSDIRHQVKGSLTFQMRREEGPTVLGMKPLQNAQLTIIPYWRTGFPYTKIDASGMEISEKNVYRQPSYWNVDLNFSKNFYLRDWFGESMKNSMIGFYVQISNVFNRREALSVYPATGNSLDQGVGSSLNVTNVGDMNATPWYKDASVANPLSYSFEQYDHYGQRLYSADADADKDGIVTQREKYEAWVGYQTESLKAKSMFQVPITVQAGLIFNF